MPVLCVIDLIIHVYITAIVRVLIANGLMRPVR